MGSPYRALWTSPFGRATERLSLRDMVGINSNPAALATPMALLFLKKSPFFCNLTSMLEFPIVYFMTLTRTA